MTYQPCHFTHISKAYPISVHTLQPTEYVYYQYLPIKMPDKRLIKIPKNISWIKPLLKHIDCDIEEYVYVTVKHMWVNEKTANREGWHIDGFLSDDVTYIWCDEHPTEFCEQMFLLTADHQMSMVEMSQQVQEQNIVIYPVNTLIKLDTSCVHRVNTQPYEGFRTFVKISVSKHRYNLQGNSHNYMFDYNWPMVMRKTERNHPIGE